MFTPFAFIKSPGPSYTLGPIVTSSLAFYINATNGNTTDTIGGQTGSISGSVDNNSNQYWGGFTVGDCIVYNTNTFNPPISGSSTFEAWLYYPNRDPTAKINTPIGLDRVLGNEDDFIYFGMGSTVDSVYTLIGDGYQSPPAKPDVEFFTTASISDKWCHVVTTINGTGLNAVNTYIQNLNGGIFSSSNALEPLNSPTNYGPNMLIGTCAAGSTGFATAFEGASGAEGYVGLVRIYNKVLSLEEIEQNYEAEKPRFESY